MTKVAFASPAKQSDYGWNQQGYKGAKAAAASVGAKFQAVTNIGYDKTDVVLRQLAQGGASFIVAHASGYDTVATRIARQYKVPVMTYDVASNLTKGLVSYITTSSQQGAYLAGILAAPHDQDAQGRDHHLGLGLQLVQDERRLRERLPERRQDVEDLLRDRVSPTGYDDAAGGKRVANSVIAQGADVIFAMGDNASFGYLQAIETAKPGHKVWFIGDIGDMTPIDKNARLPLVRALELRRHVQAGGEGHPGRHVRHARLRPEPEERRDLAAASRSTSRRRSGRRSRRRRRKIMSGAIKIPAAQQGRRSPEADQVGSRNERCVRPRCSSDTAGGAVLEHTEPTR